MRNEEPKVPLAPILVSAFGAVARDVTSGDGIGYWGMLLNVVGRAIARQLGKRFICCWADSPTYRLHFAGLKSRLQTHALQGNATKFLIQIFRLNKSVAKQRIPKPFTLHHSPFTNPWDRNPTLHSSRFLVTSYSLLLPHQCLRYIVGAVIVSTRFLTPHSSLLIFAPKGAN